MNMIIFYAIAIGAIYASYKLSMEKGQNKFVWPILTFLIGPSVFIVQYIASTLINKGNK